MVKKRTKINIQARSGLRDQYPTYCRHKAVYPSLYDDHDQDLEIPLHLQSLESEILQLPSLTCALASYATDERER